MSKIIYGFYGSTFLFFLCNKTFIETSLENDYVILKKRKWDTGLHNMDQIYSITIFVSVSFVFLSIYLFSG